MRFKIETEWVFGMEMHTLFYFDEEAASESWVKVKSFYTELAARAAAERIKRDKDYPKPRVTEFTL